MAISNNNHQRVVRTTCCSSPTFYIMNYAYFVKICVNDNVRMSLNKNSYRKPVDIEVFLKF